jgi:iron complex outermembrane recepter protein
MIQLWEWKLIKMTQIKRFKHLAFFPYISITVRGASHKKARLRKLLYEPDPDNTGVGKRCLKQNTVSASYLSHTFLSRQPLNEIYLYNLFGRNAMFKKYLLTIILLAVLPGAAAVCNETTTDSSKTYTLPSITVTGINAGEPGIHITYPVIEKSEINELYSTRDLPDLLSQLPSIFSYSQNGNAIGYTNLTMRGFDQRRIAVLINGIPQNDPEDHQVYWIDFPDLASNLELIQVQRGAASINYGAAAIGGSINMTTANYIEKKGITSYSGIGFQEYSSSGATKYQPTVGKLSAEISSGLIDNKYAVYARLSSINSDGYRDRSYAGLSSYFLSAVRFDDHLTTQINIFGGPIRDGLAYTGLPKSYIKDLKLRRLNPSSWLYNEKGDSVAAYTERRKEEIEEFSQPHIELLNNWYISDYLTFTSSLFYYQGVGFFDYDGSWADTSMLRINSENGYNPTDNPRNSIIRATVDNRQGGWIPRLTWRHGIGELTTGLELRIHRSEHFGRINYAENLPAGFDPDYKFYSYNGIRNIFSVFAREILELSDKLNLSIETQVVNHIYAIENEKAGNSYVTYTNIKGNTAGGKDKELFNVGYIFFNPRIGANYKIDEMMNIYSFAAYTSREPRMRNLYPADDNFFGGQPLFEGITMTDNTTRYDFTKPLIKPESMLNFEAGWNYTHQDYFVNLNLYWMEYYDELVKSGKVDIFGNPIDGNAKRSRHAGIELSGGVVLLSGNSGKLDLAANATYSINKIIDYDFETNAGKTVSLKDNTIAGFPDLMANLRLSYSYKGLYASVHYKFTGGMRTDNFDDMIKNNPDIKEHLLLDWMTGYYADNKLDQYSVVNFGLSYTFNDVLSLQSLRLQAQVYNLLNELYAGGAEGKDFFPAAERSFFFGVELGL